MHGRHDDTTWPACLALSPDGSLLASGSTGLFGASTIKVGGMGAGVCAPGLLASGLHAKVGRWEQGWGAKCCVCSARKQPTTYLLLPALHKPPCTSLYTLAGAATRYE